MASIRDRGIFAVVGVDRLQAVIFLEQVQEFAEHAGPALSFFHPLAGAAAKRFIARAAPATFRALSSNRSQFIVYRSRKFNMAFPRYAYSSTMKPPVLPATPGAADWF
jgi:hypothetical protein